MAKKYVDSHGISENEGKSWGHGEFANMPKDKVMKPFQKTKKMKSSNLDDAITGIDRCVDESEGRVSKYLSNQH